MSQQLPEFKCLNMFYISFFLHQVWDFESVDTADVTDTSPIFEMDAMNELKVGNNVRLKSIVKAINSEDPIWYSQVHQSFIEPHKTHVFFLA